MKKWMDILGWAGLVICLFFYFSPCVPFRLLIKGQLKVHEVPGVQIMINELLTLTGTAIGIRMKLIQAWLANGLGCFFTLIYIIIWLYYYAEKKILKFIGYLFLFLNICLQVFYIWCWWFPNLDILLWIGVVINTVMYLGPLENMRQVCKTGNYNLLPIVTIIVSLVNTFCWTCYGIGTGYLQTWLPNTLGLLFGIIEIILYFVYRKKCNGHWVDPNKAQEDENKENEENNNNEQTEENQNEIISEKNNEENDENNENEENNYNENYQEVDISSHNSTEEKDQ